MVCGITCYREHLKFSSLAASIRGITWLVMCLNIVYLQYIVIRGPLSWGQQAIACLAKWSTPWSQKKCFLATLQPVFWLVEHWLWRRTLPSRTLSTEVLRPKCESSLHLKISGSSIICKSETLSSVCVSQIKFSTVAASEDDSLSSFVPDRGSWKSCNQSGVADSGDLWAPKTGNLH